MKIDIKKDIYENEKNTAEKLRNIFKEFDLPVINLIGSPGCGKTTVLESVLLFMKNKGKVIGIIEGDIKTSLDADRLTKFDMPIVTVNTNGGCHLSIEDIVWAVEKLPLAELDMLIIENVGNLVCPAAFDLGESLKIAMLSTPEGDEKPLKYPALFKEAGLVILSKTELAELSRFDITKAKQNILSVNPEADIIMLSVFDGQTDELSNYLLDLL